MREFFSRDRQRMAIDGLIRLRFAPALVGFGDVEQGEPHARWRGRGGNAADED